MEPIAEKIKRIRNEKRLSKKEVAEICGLSPSSYLYIEEGKTKSISIEVGKGIAKALEVPFDELFEIENDQSQSKFSEQEFNSLLETLENSKVLINQLIAKNEEIKNAHLIEYVYDTLAEIHLYFRIIDMLPEDLKQDEIRHCVFILETKRDQLQKNIDDGIFTKGDYDKAIKWYDRTVSGFSAKDPENRKPMFKQFNLLEIKDFKKIFTDYLDHDIY